jgi:hypothetical protein
MKNHPPRSKNKGENFKLSSNIEDSGNFDDNMYTSDDRSYFLELKHSSNPNTPILKKTELKEILTKVSNPTAT